LGPHRRAHPTPKVTETLLLLFGRPVPKLPARILSAL